MQYKAIMLDEYLNELGNKDFQPTDEFFTFKKGTFNIRLDAFLYRNKNTTFYGYIYPTDEKLLIDNKIEPIKEPKDKDKITLNSPRLIKIREKWEKGDLKLIVGESIIGQLARMAVMGLKTNWILLLIVAVSVGVGVGGAAYSYGLGSGVSQGFEKAQQIYNSTINLHPTSTPIIIHP